VKNSIAFKKGDPLAWGRSKCAIRAPKEDILAYIWAMDARCRWGDTDLEREILEKKSLHSIVVYQLKGGSKHGPLKLKPRGGVQQLVWKQVDARTLVIAVQPVESHPAKPSSDGVVDAQMHLTIVLRESGPRSCNFTYVARMDLGGDVPNAISNFYLWKNLGLGHRMQVYVGVASEMHSRRSRSTANFFVAHPPAPQVLRGPHLVQPLGRGGRPAAWRGAPPPPT
jgi:hypothetical protein